MPKIRRYKDWLFEPDWFTDPTDPIASISRSQSYLSDTAVIASMSDERLSAAISHYKRTLQLLESELYARKVENRSAIPIAWPGMFGPSAHYSRAARPKNKRLNLRLTKSQLEQAVRILTQIMENK